MTHVVICIVGFRNPGDIEGCLNALAASTHRHFEVVICENGGSASRNSLAARVGDRLPSGQSVTILTQDDNLGYAGGNNLCIQSSSHADLWWILNPDTCVAPDAMALLVAHLAAGKSDAVGGTLLRGDGRVQAYGGRWLPLLARAVSIGNGEVYDAASQAAADLDYIVGASIMVTPGFVSVAGLMRHDYFLYGEEVEWCLRAKARGLRLGVEPRALIHHAQGTTTGDSGSFRHKPRYPVFLDQRNKMLILRDTSPVLLPVGAFGSLVALLARAVKNRAWLQLGYGLSGWAAGLTNQRGIPMWMKY